MNTELIYRKWVKLGYGFTDTAFNGIVDLEDLILESVLIVRSDPRLFICLITWIKHHGTLINVQKLIPKLNTENETLIGLVMELAVSKGADKKLLNISRHCKSDDNIDFLFDVVKKYQVKMSIEKDSCLPIFKKWGFYCSEDATNEKVVETRKYVLKKNLNLAIRAMIGVSSKAEIIYNLIDGKRIHIKEICRNLKMSYQPIYKEVEDLVANGFLISERIGNMKFISMPIKTQKYLKSIPL